MSNKLNILLTNDDGIDGEGINVLKEKLKEVAEVYVLAPDSNRSAVSSHIVMFNQITFKKHTEREWSCSAFPADCVIAALRSQIFGDVVFDAVISGINKGGNMGTDCIYSGTVAAARQAVLYKVPGIAVSLKKVKGDDSGDTYVSGENDSCKEWNFEALADFVRDNLLKLVSLYQEDTIININGISASKYKGVKFCSLCIRHYNDKVIMKEIKPGVYSGVFEGGEIQTTGDSLNEYTAVKSGMIAITRIHAEPVSVKDGQDSLTTDGFKI